MQRGENPGDILRHMKECLHDSFAHAGLRQLLLESAGFEGVFKAVKDYLPPVLKATAVATAACWILPSEMSEIRQVTLLVGPIFLLLHLLEGFASRNAHRVSEWIANENDIARALWATLAVVFSALGVAAYFENSIILISTFVALHILHNLWRPMLLTRIDSQSSESRGATLLSIESQTCRTTTMFAAPAIGFAVDWVLSNQIGDPSGQ